VGTDLAALPVHRARRALTAAEADELVGAVVGEREANVTTAGLWVDDDTGEPVFAYYPMSGGAEELRAAVLQVKYGETLRAKTGLRNRSKTFGMSPRRPTHRRESCRPAGMANEQPEIHSVIVAMADRLADDLREFAPAQAAQDAAVLAEEVSPEWRMTESSLWTSGVVNKSSTLPFHRDGFNFQLWSAMPVLRRGMTGGYLAVPEYDIVCACRDGWVLYFPGWQLVHGVTPMRSRADDGYRYSVVYYALRGMKSCFEYALEVGEARKRRTDREQGMADEVTGKAPPRLVTAPGANGIPMGRMAEYAGGPGSARQGQTGVIGGDLP
jgi:hypothetical protein